MTIYDIAQSYQTLFNEGKYKKLSIINKSFNPYELTENVYKKDVASIYNRQNVRVITDALKTVLDKGGTAHSLSKYLPQNVQFMAKTGTTDEYRHGYTVLSDGETLVVSWVSYGQEVNGVLRFNQTAIPNRSGGSSAGILAAFIFDELYKN
jgi:membrane peptidoglycan carboxypeptidase